MLRSGYSDATAIKRDPAILPENDDSPSCSVALPCVGGFIIISPSSRNPDIDECADPDTCSQICVNQIGSYKCQCQEGYQVDPATKACKAIGEYEFSEFLQQHVDVPVNSTGV